MISAFIAGFMLGACALAIIGMIILLFDESKKKKPIVHGGGMFSLDWNTKKHKYSINYNNVSNEIKELTQLILKNPSRAKCRYAKFGMLNGSSFIIRDIKSGLRVHAGEMFDGMSSDKHKYASVDNEYLCKDETEYLFEHIAPIFYKRIERKKLIKNIPYLKSAQERRNKALSTISKAVSHCG